MSEYEKYCKEIFELYQTTSIPQSGAEHAHGDVVIEDVEKDMSWIAIDNRRKEEDRRKRIILADLISDFVMEE